MRIPKYKLVREGSVEYSSRTGRSITTPAGAAMVLKALIGEDVRECLAVLFLDSQHMPLGVHIVGVGTLNHCLVEPREVFGPAMLARAYAIIVAHNHPSGNTRPSQEDRGIWERLKGCGGLLGVEVLDFLVLAGDSWESVKEAKVEDRSQ